jgi:hypothetical protein
MICVERTIMNVRERRLQCWSRNTAGADIMEATETSSYTTDPNDPSVTIFEQSGSFSASPFFGLLRRPLETWVGRAVKEAGEKVYFFASQLQAT